MPRRALCAAALVNANVAILQGESGCLSDQKVAHCASQGKWGCFMLCASCGGLNVCGGALFGWLRLESEGWSTAGGGGGWLTCKEGGWQGFIASTKAGQAQQAVHSRAGRAGHAMQGMRASPSGDSQPKPHAND